MSSIKITAGALTIEYTGEQKFIENGLLDLVKELSEVDVPTHVVSNPTNANGHTGGGTQINHLSTNTIASQMSAQSGTDLIIAALAHLQLVAGKDKATRMEISQEMKSATTYYKSTFTSNLSSYFNSLVKAKKLNQIAENTYALSASEREAMEKLLAAA
tara:strand:- start:977 stop:1453 length:477 start_codon:yes stop_codon:yes gene_type:complete